MHSKKELWPVMLTPFTSGGDVDYNGVRKLIEWYEQSGADGLFAVCLSGEMFFLSLEERIKLAAFVKKHANIPVVASGHISTNVSDQLNELRRLSETGIDALVLVTNRFAAENDTAAQWQNNLEQILNGLDDGIPLGLYECPYPYKHLLTDDGLAFCNSTGRFLFLKDTCCDIDTLRRRLNILKYGGIKLYNANTATLLESYHLGAAGYSGVMANFHPELYVQLSQIWQEKERAALMQSFLTTCAHIERQLYPVNAKYHFKKLGLPIDIYTKSKNYKELTETFKDEVCQMNMLVNWFKRSWGNID